MTPVSGAVLLIALLMTNTSYAADGSMPVVGVPAVAVSAVGEAEQKSLTRRVSPLTTVPLWNTGQYIYDGAGNITAIGTVASPSGENKTSTFLYDAASRLTDATIGRTAGDVHETYAYDGFGNITEHRRYTPDAITYSPAPSYVNNRMTEAGMQYDEAGNVTTLGSGRTLTYDGFKQVTSQTLNSNTYNYIYDVNEERVGIQYGTTTHWTIRDFDNKPIIQFDSSQPLSSGSWSTTQWIENVQIHVGNTKKDVKGCFAAGTERSADEVSSSTDAVKSILGIIEKDKSKKITVEVVGANKDPKDAEKDKKKENSEKDKKPKAK